MQAAIHSSPHLLGQLLAKLGEQHPELLKNLLEQVGTDAKPSKFPPLHLETRDAVDTATAAHHLNRTPQTLRCWACEENGPIRPFRINGRLAWKTSDIRRALGVAQ